MEVENHSLFDKPNDPFHTERFGSREGRRMTLATSPRQESFW